MYVYAIIIQSEFPITSACTSAVCAYFWPLLLNHGELIAHGTPDEIKVNPVVIEAYLGKEDGEQ